ncbi:MAG: hypothetical protein AAFQ68_24615, partial [Bacteroidota bacterium]
LLASLSLTSCLTITESYYFAKDGSGNMQFLVDLSQMSGILNYADQEQQSSSVEDLSFVEIVKQLKQIDGIYEVALLDDPSIYQWGVSYEFANTVALNKALNVLLMKKGNQSFHPFVEYHGQQFVSQHRFDKFQVRDRLSDDERFAPLVEEAMKKMDYHIQYEFARPIKAVYAKQEVKLAGKKPKNLGLKCTLWELEDNTQLLDATLILK